MVQVPYPLIATAATPSSLVLASNSSIHLVNPSGPSSRTFTLPSAPAGPSALIRQLAISPDSQYAATVSDDKGLRTYSLSEPITILSTRYLTKKPSTISFIPGTTNDIIVSDKVGDCYLYPLEPRDVSIDKLKKLDIQADPTLNPEATYLLGHVSVLTAHIITEDEQGKKWIITADRDEHIRVTRYPNTYVIDKYMFGTDGFVSSIHIPHGHPELLLSGGGEGVLRLWNWKEGKLIGSIEVGDAILPHRSARSTLRKDKRKTKGKKAKGSEVEVEVAKEEEKDFYNVPEGWMLPSGQGILIRQITSLRIGESTVILFYSEGASAIHSFVFKGDTSSSITTFSTPYPVLNYALVPGTTDQILLTLDTTFNTVAFNQVSGQRPKFEGEISEDQGKGMEKSYLFVQISSDGTFTDMSSSHPLSSTLHSIVTDSSNLTSPQTLSQLNLYPDLSLFPRWPGLEEDDDLAGPAPTAEAPAEIQTGGPVFPKKEYTQSEYEAMNLKHLGRLKAQGYDVEGVMRVKRRETKDRRFEAKRARLEAGLSEPSKDEMELAEEEGVEDEEAGNA